jgi:hypothetical protein
MSHVAHFFIHRPPSSAHLTRPHHPALDHCAQRAAPSPLLLCCFRCFATNPSSPVPLPSGQRPNAHCQAGRLTSIPGSLLTCGLEWLYALCCFRFFATHPSSRVPLPSGQRPNAHCQAGRLTSSEILCCSAALPHNPPASHLPQPRTTCASLPPPHRGVLPHTGKTLPSSASFAPLPLCG